MFVNGAAFTNPHIHRAAVAESAEERGISLTAQRIQRARLIYLSLLASCVRMARNSHSASKATRKKEMEERLKRLIVYAQVALVSSRLIGVQSANRWQRCSDRALPAAIELNWHYRGLERR